MTATCVRVVDSREQLVDAAVARCFEPGDDAERLDVPVDHFVHVFRLLTFAGSLIGHSPGDRPCS